jgi:anti-sigma B factor antagonist
MGAIATPLSVGGVSRGMRAGPLSIRAFEEPERHVLELTGELDISGVSHFERAAGQVLDQGARSLLLDISGIEFIDSTGLRSILAVKARCEELGCEFSVTHASGQVDRVLALTRLLDRLPFRSGRRDPRRRELDLWSGSA